MTKTLQRVTIAPKQVNMTDINRSRPKPSGPRAVSAVPVSGEHGPDHGAVGDGAPATVAPPIVSPNVAIVELMFFAYRDFTAAADAILSGYGLGRAHHRVLHFVERNPGLRVADLLDLLRITKQSLARVLKQLIDEDWIAQRATIDDRRVRRLYTTAKGGELAKRLIALQSDQIGRSLQATDAAVVRQFLHAMVSAENRDHVAALIMGNAALAVDAVLPRSQSTVLPGSSASNG